MLIAPAALFVSSAPSHASYAMTQAAESSHTWSATGADKEKAVYRSIEESIDAKRRFRPEADELGYVGGSYTKKAAAERLNMADKSMQSDKKASYMTTEEVLILSRRAKLAQP